MALSGSAPTHTPSAKPAPTRARGPWPLLQPIPPALFPQGLATLWELPPILLCDHTSRCHSDLLKDSSSSYVTAKPRKTKVVNRGGEDRSGGRRQSQPTPLVCSHNKKKPAAPARGAWLQGPYCSLQLLTASFFATQHQRRRLLQRQPQCCCKAILLCKCWIGEEVLKGEHVLARETYVGSLWI